MIIPISVHIVIINKQFVTNLLLICKKNRKKIIETKIVTKISILFVVKSEIFYITILPKPAFWP